MRFSALLLVAAARASGSLSDRPWMNPNDPPEARAKVLLAKMTQDEKVHMLHGSGSAKPYIGNVEGNTRLGIPALKLNDGPQGFRCGSDTCKPGSTTAWPSGMTVGATWDQDLAGQWGKVMGKEFYDKGANIQLGPGLCLARVPVCGRNFEYISGEDPYLGYTMVQPVIRGIQSSGVVANAKHWVNNNQEDNRGAVSENVAERVRFEMYYPPFEGAIEAGVGSFMCSYNKINNTYSCENNMTLATDLKERLGFNGWVMSDWGATHSTSINQGLDQEMPGYGFMSDDEIKAAVTRGSVDQAKVDDSVLRILTPLFAVGAFDNPTNGSLADNVTSAEANALARELSRSATVLLKNNNNALPITKSIKKIAVIGAEATNPTVHGGGSGRVDPPYVIAPYDVIRSRMGLSGSKTNNCSEAQWVDGIDFYNQDGQTQTDAASIDECCSDCAKRPGCYAFTFRKSMKQCWLKSDANNPQKDGDAISGTCAGEKPKECNDAGDVCVYYASNADDAKVYAASADMAIVFVATTSSEGGDRSDLSLGKGQDDLITATASANPNTIVVFVTPGALLTPWSDNANVSAILNANTPGQEYGNAITDVLFGDYNPSAKLTLTMPNKDNEVGFTEAQYPGLDNAAQATYYERLEVGYRYYDAKQIKPKFPFGFGLSYTEFDYSDLKVSNGDSATDNKVSFTLKNSGAVDGAEVAQLYVGFPATAGEPPKQLKGFAKTMLKAGESQTVTITTNDRTFSIWDEQTHAWTVVKGDFDIFVGSSSRDARLTGKITIN